MAGRRGDAIMACMCGVFGVFAPGQPVAHLTYLGLYALQHRGQESAGMAVADDGASLTVVKDMGLVSNVFDDRTLAALSGSHAIGHCRYSTTGSSTWRNAQPVYRDVGRPPVRPGPQRQPHQHRGAGRRRRDAAGHWPRSDTDLVAELLAQHMTATGDDLVDALAAVLPTLEGAYSLVLVDDGQIIGARDPDGFRPLCLGRLDGGWVLASETPALDIVGAELVRELEPGEIVAIDGDGPRTRAGRAGRGDRTPGCACSSSSTSPGPTPSSTAATWPPPAPAWASCSPSRRRWRPTRSTPSGRRW